MSKTTTTEGKTMNTTKIPGFYFKSYIKSNGRIIRSYASYTGNSRMYVVGEELFFNLAAARSYTRSN